MGPLASIGDSIFGSLLPTIFGALAANMAMQGNPLGIFIWIAVNIVVDWFRCKQTYIAYDQGMKLVTTMSDQLNAITRRRYRHGRLHGGRACLHQRRHRHLRTDRSGVA